MNFRYIASPLFRSRGRSTVGWLAGAAAGSGGWLELSYRGLVPLVRRGRSRRHLLRQDELPGSRNVQAIVLLFMTDDDKLVVAQQFSTQDYSRRFASRRRLILIALIGFLIHPAFSVRKCVKLCCMSGAGQARNRHAESLQDQENIEPQDHRGADYRPNIGQPAVGELTHDV